jgi:hypothetical protein
VLSSLLSSVTPGSDPKLSIATALYRLPTERGRFEKRLSFRAMAWLRGPLTGITGDTSRSAVGGFINFRSPWPLAIIPRFAQN